MTRSSSLIGMPWQLVKFHLQAAHIPFKVIIGDNYNRFFEVASEGYYVARITESENMLNIILYRPMVASDFGHTLGVMYAEETI